MYSSHLLIYTSILQYFNISIFQYFNISIFQYFNISIFQYFNISIFQYVINFTLALWGEAKIRRQFFLSYAKQNGFDYLVPSNWYDQPREKIMAAKVCIDQSV